MKKRLYISFIITFLSLITIFSIEGHAVTIEESIKQHYAVQDAEFVKSPFNAAKQNENVSTFSGELSFDVTDLVLPGKNGFNVEVKRHYGSKREDETPGAYHNSSKTATTTYFNKGFLYRNSANNQYYHIVFNSEQDMLSKAPDSFYANNNFLNEGVYSKNHTNYYYYKYEKIVSSTATANLMVRQKDIPEEPVSFNVLDKMEVFWEPDITYAGRNKIGRNWSYCFPDIGFKRGDPFDDHGDYPIQDEIWENFYVIDFDGNTFEVGFGREKYKGVWYPLSRSYIRDQSAYGYECEYVSINNITIDASTPNEISYNRTITDPKGRIMYINAEKQLVAIDDKYGNRIRYSGNTITDTMGRTITFGKTGVTYTEPGNAVEKRISYDLTSINSAEDTEENLKTDDTYMFTVTNEEGEETKYYQSLKQLLFFPKHNISRTSYAYYSDSYVMDRIAFPNNDEKIYEYQEVSNYYLNYDSSKLRYKIIRSKDIISGNDQNEYTYTYNNPDEGWKSTSPILGSKSRTADGRTETDNYPDNTDPCKVSTVLPNKTITYEYSQYGYGRKLLSSSTQTESGYITKQINTYDNKRINIISETDGVYTAAYTYDPTYNMMLTKTYARDSAHTIKIENTLSQDKKSIISTKVLENNILKTQTDFEYDTFGNIVQTHFWEADANGNNLFDISERTTLASTYTYNNNGTMDISAAVSGISDADGVSQPDISVSQSFDYYGYLLSSQDPNQNVTELEYDLIGRATRRINPDNTERNLSYNAQTNSAELTDESGNKIKEVYDMYGRVLKKYAYISSNWVLMLENTYNSKGLLASSRAYKTASKYLTTEYEYNAHDRVHITTLRDESNNLIGQTTQTYAFNSTNMIVTTVTLGDTGDYSITPPTKKEYFDTVGNKVKEEYIDGGNTSTLLYTYDYLKNVLTSTDPMNNTTTVTYDYAGNQLTVTNPNNQTITNTYDKKGRLVSTTDFKGNVTTSTYDILDRVNLITSPANAKLKYYYDNNSNVTAEKVLSKIESGTEIWNQKVNTYNSRNMLTSVTVGEQAEQSYASYEYMPNGQISALNVGFTEPQVTSYQYNSLGQLTAVTDPLNQTESYVYDWFGNVTQKVDKNGETTNTTYNAFNQPISIQAGSDSISNTYDFLGNLRASGNSTSYAAYSYDNFGRMITEEAQVFKNYNIENFNNQTGANINILTNNYTYDKNNNRLSYVMQKDGVTQISANYVYNNLNALTSVTNNGIMTSYQYDNNGNITSEITNGRESEYVYDSANRLIYMFAAGNNENYTYYLDGNMQSKYAQAADTYSTYEYDSAGRLKNEEIELLGIINPSFQIEIDAHNYTYDEYSNRATKTSTNSITNYIYDSNNRLLRETMEMSSETVINAYNYDNNGNLYSKMIERVTEVANGSPSVGMGIMGLDSDTESILYNYNGFNQLTSVVKGSESISYDYNPNGLRNSKTVGEVMTSHIWDGMHMVGEYQNGDITAKYLRGLRLVARQYDNTTEYYNFNGHGDTTSLVDASGNVVVNYAFDAFGNQLTEAQNDTNPFRYCGEYQDFETDMIYLRARYYDPGIGRFISEDPIKDGLNWYVYCGGNPVNFWDPSGLADEYLTSLVKKTTGSIRWDEKASMATVTIDGTTKYYLVKDGQVYYANKNGEQGNKAGYIKNEKIMVDDGTFDNDYNIVGTLTISSYWKEGEKVNSSLGESEEYSGHSFIHYKSDDGKFNTYYSTWKWKYDEAGYGGKVEAPGLYINRDEDKKLATDLNNTVSLSKRITKNQQAKMAKEITDKNNNTWSNTNNCAGFANKVFKAATGIAFDGYPLTPKKLKAKIEAKNSN